MIMMLMMTYMSGDGDDDILFRRNMTEQKAPKREFESLLVTGLDVLIKYESTVQASICKHE